MFGIITKKKISDDQIANIMVNGILKMTEEGFNDIIKLISEDSIFIERPQLQDRSDDSFLMIIITGNLYYLKNYFPADKSSDLKELIIEAFAKAFGVETRELDQNIKNLESFISRINHPSKNMLYGMSKAIFYKYNLNQYQEDYFKDVNSPNPVFIKHLNLAMENFIWDWSAILKKRRVTN
jgi:hypothetical protein